MVINKNKEEYVPITRINDTNNDDDIDENRISDDSLIEDDNIISKLRSYYEYIIKWIHKYTITLVLYRTFSSPMVQCTLIGIGIGTIGVIQKVLFFDFTPLTPVGRAIETLAQPMVAVNCLIMSSSLASINIFRPKNENAEKEKNDDEYINRDIKDKKKEKEISENFDIGDVVNNNGGLNYIPESEGFQRVRSMSMTDFKNTQAGIKCFRFTQMCMLFRFD